jgi:RES domain-containing protein
MITAWRIVGANHQNKAFTGDGARIHGGRWNSKGVAVVYTADSLALASLEMMVNLPAPKLLEKYVRISAHFDPNIVSDLSKADLPLDWNSRPISPSTRTIGDRWIKMRSSAVLRVPSIVVPDEHNYLLNPTHPDFTKIKIGKPIVYLFDPRLTKH